MNKDHNEDEPMDDIEAHLPKGMPEDMKKMIRILAKNGKVKKVKGGLMGMVNMGDAMQAMSQMGDGAEDCGHDHSKDKLVKSFPMKKEWVKRWKEIGKLAMEMDIMLEAIKQKEQEGMSKRKALWGLIETELGIYGQHLKIQDQKEPWEIELYESPEDNKK